MAFEGQELLTDVVELLERNGEDEDGQELALAWTVGQIAKELGVARGQVQDTLDFLLSEGRARRRERRSGVATYRRAEPNDRRWDADRSVVGRIFPAIELPGGRTLPARLRSI